MKWFVIACALSLFLTGCKSMMGGEGSTLGDGKLGSIPLSTIVALVMATQSGGGAGAISGLLGGGLGGAPADPIATVAAGEAAICDKITVAAAEARYGPIGSPRWTAYRQWCDGLKTPPTAS